MNLADRKAALHAIYRAALDAVAPGPALTRALDPWAGAPRDFGGVWIIALGKGAQPMAGAATRVLLAAGHAPAGGLVVSPVEGPRPHPSIAMIVGDHPEPGPGSFAAAEALERLVRQIPNGHAVWVLLSGGTTSLIGAPQPGIAPHELTDLYARLLRSGLDIRALNRVRKRFTRWSAGRLARSLAHAGRVQCFTISDVIGDDLAAIGSGPCVADPSTAREVRDALAAAGLWDQIASSIREHLEQVERGRIPETPKAGDPAVDRVESQLIATNRVALDAAASRAAELGFVPALVEAPIVGEAAKVGATLALTLLNPANPGDHPGDLHCLILGGETTVTLGAGSGQGGRSQELALAAARDLRGSDHAALLAAGTDGRDGPTDAAGALVDGTTWDRISAAGRDPERDLRDHNSYAALAAADALIKTGPTGTNVMDVVLGIRGDRG
jgi:glycerate 2-kinase